LREILLHGEQLNLNLLTNKPISFIIFFTMKKHNCAYKLILLLLLAFIVSNTTFTKPQQKNYETINLPNEIRIPKFFFANNYSPIYSGAKLAIPSFTFNMPLENIPNYNNFKSIIPLTNQNEETLKKDGCVIIPYKQLSHFVNTYNDLIENEIPLFITSDTLLYYFKLYFNALLINIEENTFAPELSQMLRELVNKFHQIYQDYDGEIKEAAKKNLILFSVANKLLNPDTADTPAEIKDEVNETLQIIKSKYQINYTPTQHYSANQTLQNYFQATQWLKQIILYTQDINSSSTFSQDFKIQALQVLLIIDCLNQIEINGQRALNIWEKFFAVYNFYNQNTNEPSLPEFIIATKKVFGQIVAVTDFLDDAKLKNLMIELKKYNYATQSLFNNKDEKVKGIRFFPASINTDDIIFNNLILTKVGTFAPKRNQKPFTLYNKQRVFPRALDIMSLLACSKATSILQDTNDSAYSLYNRQMLTLKQELMTFTLTDWHQNLYWSWLSLSKTLLYDFTQGYHHFMKSEQWHLKELQTALSAWLLLQYDPYIPLHNFKSADELRKINSTLHPHNKKIKTAFLEPVPDFYSELLALTKMIHDSLRSLNLLQELPPFNSEYIEGMLSRIAEISKKELRLENLNDNDIAFLGQIAEQINIITLKTNTFPTEMPFVNNIYTHRITNQSLFEAIGYPYLVVVIYIPPDSAPVLAAGPTFSYFEFKQKSNIQLDNDKWLQMLKSNPPPVLLNSN